MNCWEFKECGRQPDGDRIELLGICPATIEEALDGTNGGKNGGRCCWKVSGTYCDGDVQGSFSTKIKDCIDCDFFKSVLVEEGKDFNFML